MRFPLSSLLLAVCLGLGTGPALADDIKKVNGSVRVEKGQTADTVRTVNGSVSIDDEAKVGDASTVNGSLTLGNKVSARSLKTVNGAIRGGQGTRVDNDISSVNGGVHLEAGSSAKNIANVNGNIVLIGTQVSENLETVNGSITLSDATKITGSVTFRKPKGSQWGKQDKPFLSVAAGVEVGSVILEREVDLRIDKDAKVGKIEKRYENP